MRIVNVVVPTVPVLAGVSAAFTQLGDLALGGPLDNTIFVTDDFDDRLIAIDVTNRILRSETQKLEKDGYEVIRAPTSYGIAWVHGIRIVGDEMDGGADPGADGMVVAVN